MENVEHVQKKKGVRHHLTDESCIFDIHIASRSSPTTIYLSDNFVKPELFESDLIHHEHRTVQFFTLKTVSIVTKYNEKNEKNNRL